MQPRQPNTSSVLDLHHVPAARKPHRLAAGVPVQKGSNNKEKKKEKERERGWSEVETCMGVNYYRDGTRDERRKATDLYR